MSLDQICKTYAEVTALQPALSEWILKAIKSASHDAAGEPKPGCPFTGRITTPRRLLRWIEHNPGFVPNHHVRRSADKSAHPRTSSRRPVSTVDRSGGSVRSRDEHTPSPAARAPQLAQSA